MNPLFRDMTPKMPILAVQSLTSRNALGLAQSAEGQVQNLINSGTSNLKQTMTATSAGVTSLESSVKGLTNQFNSQTTSTQSSLKEIKARITRLEDYLVESNLPPLSKYL